MTKTQIVSASIAAGALAALTFAYLSLAKIRPAMPTLDAELRSGRVADVVRPHQENRLIWHDERFTLWYRSREPGEARNPGSQVSAAGPNYEGAVYVFDGTSFVGAYPAEGGWLPGRMPQVVRFGEGIVLLTESRPSFSGTSEWSTSGRQPSPVNQKIQTLVKVYRFGSRGPMEVFSDTFEDGVVDGANPSETTYSLGFSTDWRTTIRRVTESWSIDSNGIATGVRYSGEVVAGWDAEQSKFTPPSLAKQKE